MADDHRFVSYAELVPDYTYRLPCGALFRTQIKSQDDKGTHWFPCRRCSVTHGLREGEFVMTPPAYNGSMDDAIIRDRIAHDLRISWGAVPAQDIADRNGRSVTLVYEIAQRLGVWNRRELQ